MTDLLVPARFCGPPSSGNGGWTAGAMAELVHGAPARPWGAVAGHHRHPAPAAAARHHGARHRDRRRSRSRPTTPGRSPTARRADAALTEVEAVDASTARAAEASYAGWASHPFTTCFTCGPDRAEGDGLRIFPGPVDDLDGEVRVAAAWTPHPSTAEDWHAYEDDHRRASIPVHLGRPRLPRRLGGRPGDIPRRPRPDDRPHRHPPRRRRGARRRRPLPRPRGPQDATPPRPCTTPTAASSPPPSTPGSASTRPQFR